jgi:hypothetical protein
LNYNKTKPTTITATMTEETTATATAAATSTAKPHSLDLHAWMDAQQTAHGVRHDDYSQYHAYCTRRLSRLSHQNPETKKYLVCSSKFTTSTSTSTEKKAQGSGGGRHAYSSRQPDTFASTTTTTTTTTMEGEGESSSATAVVVPHVNILWYLLVLAERSWAHANELQKQGKRRQQVLRKLKKAKGWADKLLEMAHHDTTVAVPVVEATTYQECQAYASWMSANYALEKLDYQVCTCHIHIAYYCRV